MRDVADLSFEIDFGGSADPGCLPGIALGHSGQQSSTGLVCGVGGKCLVDRVGGLIFFSQGELGIGQVVKGFHGISSSTGRGQANDGVLMTVQLSKSDPFQDQRGSRFFAG